jgi:CheY-like chemotaxis protein
MPDPSASKIRIAVIDDEQMILNVFSSLMHQFNYQADFYSDSVKGLDEVIQNPGRYQLVICDINMPILDGITVGEKIRLVLPALPIMFMTGANISEEQKKKALSLGNVTFLNKPFPLVETLKETIPKVLRQQ